MPDIGLGFLDIDPAPDLYAEDYFAHYRELDRTRMGAALNAVRLDLVERHWQGAITDIGIGGGAFVSSHPCATGWDINVHAIRWLYDCARLRDVRTCRVDAVSMWDSIEHMRDPSLILGNVDRWVFISTPVYTDAHHALASKHFKPGEHLWYFTQHGLIAYMRRVGFALRELNDLETALGREDIRSFAFERV